MFRKTLVLPLGYAFCIFLDSGTLRSIQAMTAAFFNDFINLADKTFGVWVLAGVCLCVCWAKRNMYFTHVKHFSLTQLTETRLFPWSQLCSQSYHILSREREIPKNDGLKSCIIDHLMTLQTTRGQQHSPVILHPLVAQGLLSLFSPPDECKSSIHSPFNARCGPITSK